jgi:hypothetical protein
MKIDLNTPAIAELADMFNSKINPLLKAYVWFLPLLNNKTYLYVKSGNKDFDWGTVIELTPNNEVTEETVTKTANRVNEAYARFILRKK